MTTSALAVRSLLDPIRSVFERRDFSLRDPALWRLFGNNVSTAAGMSVSEDTALNLPTVWACVRLISDYMGSMPLKVYKRDKNGIKDEYKSSKLYRLLHDQPNPEMTAITFREVMQGHLLTWGNAYALIEWNPNSNNNYDPIALWPVTPDRVVVYRDTYDRRIKYRLSSSGGPDRIIDRDDMIHIPGLGFDGLVGYSVIGRMRQSLGLTAAAERFGATFFGNGAHVTGILSTEDDLDEQQKNEVRAEIDRIHKGPDKANRVMVLSGGQFKYERMSMPPNDAQFLETRKQQNIEICKMFGVPPHMVFELDRSTNNNIESQGMDFLANTLRFHAEKWVQELERKLISPLERNYLFVDFVFADVIKADIQTRYNAYSVAHQNGWLSVDDIRELENLNPLPNGAGAIYLSPTNMVPSETFKDYVSKKLQANDAKVQMAASAKQAKTGDPAEDPKPGAPPSLARALEEAITRAVHAEHVASEARSEAQRAGERVRDLEAEKTVSLAEVQAAKREEAAARALAEQMTAIAHDKQRDADQLQVQLEAATQATAAAETRATELAADRDRLAGELAEAQSEAETRAAVTADQLSRAQAALRQHVRDVERLRREATAASQAAERERRQAGLAIEERDMAAALAAQAEAKCNALDGQLATVSGAAEGLQWEVDKLSTELTVARRDLQAVHDSRTANAEAIATAESRCQTLEQQIQAATADAEAARAREAELIATRDQAEARYRDAMATLAVRDAAAVEHGVALTEAVAARDDAATARDEALAREAQLEADLTATRDRAETAQRDLEVATAAIAASDQARKEALAQAEMRRIAAETALNERDHAIEQLRTAESETITARSLADATQQEIAIAAARIEEARAAQLEAQRLVAAESERRTQAERDRDAAAAERAQLAVEIEARRLREEESARVLAQLRAQLNDRTAAEIAGHRILYVETMRRMIRSETDRLRRHQATPDKMRRGVEAFYDGFEEHLANALLDGVIQTHLGFVRSPEDPRRVAQRLAREHVEESRRQVLFAVDDESYETAMTALWHRWETDRVNTVADLLMQKELEYARLA